MSCVNGTASADDDDLQRNLNHFTAVKQLTKFSVGTPNICVLKSSITTVCPTNSRFAVALSNKLVKIYDMHGISLNEYEHDSSVSHIKFSNTNPDILLTSSLGGKIQVWDLRNSLCVQTFCDNMDGSFKPILCFDCNDEMICAGTELIREDAFHLFWDLRSSNILGGYWNSHAGDITEIHFHPDYNHCMASSSVDGLINIFDLNEISEDDALVQTINVEAPVNTFMWKSKNVLSCTTSVEEYHLIKMKSAQSALSISRERLLQDFQIKPDCMIDSLPIKKFHFLATGKNSGEVHLWNFDEKNPYPDKHNISGYFLKGHTDVVRTISYSECTDMVITGGDDGCVCLWKLQSDEKLLNSS